MENNTSYLRIGTSYYKKINKPLISGDTLEVLAPWSKDCIKDDHNDKTYINNIKKYDGFCCVPSHIGFKQEISGFYNTYSELTYKPKAGSIDKSLEFMKHVFGDQIELGLDFLKILYEKPTQILPILCLVSTQRNTGKTTFLNWLKNIFSKNMTTNTNDDFRSQFNSDWLSKLIVAVDEVLLNAKEDTERFKNLGTTRTYKVEAKGKDKREIEFFGKFILCSNNETSFIQIQPGEIRFWVRKIIPFQFEDENYLEKLISEIPAFLNFLMHREYSVKRTTRMWFTAAQIKTEALKKLINSNKNKVELELINSIIEIIETFELDEFCFVLSDLQNILSKSPYRNISKTRLKTIIKEIWGLNPASNSLRYKKYNITSQGAIYEDLNNNKGRYFTIKKAFITENYDDLMPNNSKQT